MTAKIASRTLVQLACAALFVGGLGACGGGGGGGGTSQPESVPPTLAITSLNSDAVGHFTAVAAFSLPISWLSETSLSLTGGGALSAPLGSRFPLFESLRSRFAQAGGGRSHALEVASIGKLPCNFGGTISGTIDDVDNNQVESPGDVETIQLSNCVMAPGETYNGAIRFDVVEVTGSSATYNATLSQLSYVTPKHALTFNGSYAATDFATVNSVRTTTLTVNDSITVKVTTHAPYSDTVTFGKGFVVQDQIDYGSQHNVLSVSGRVQSASAGGSVDVSTPSALLTTRSGIAGLYPEAGELKAQGKTGSLSVKALSSASVRLDTDSNDDGATESSNAQSWEWLL